MVKGSTLLYKNIIDKIVDGKNENYNKVFFSAIEEKIGFIPLKFIRDYLGDGQTIEFMDILSGDSIKFPTDKELRDLLIGTQIYIYYESLGKDEINLPYVARKFGITKLSARKYIKMFDKDYDIDKEKTFGEIEDEENYIDTDDNDDDMIDFSDEEDLDWLGEECEDIDED